MHVYESFRLCCDSKSDILHVNVSGLHQTISVFIFVCAVNCFVYDELFGYGQWHAPICPTRLALACCAWALV